MTDPAWLREARAEGRILSETGPKCLHCDGNGKKPGTDSDCSWCSGRGTKRLKKEPPKLCVATFRPSLERPVWEIPLETRSEINLRDFRKRSKRTDAAWRAVSKAIGPHLAYLVRFAADFHAGLPVYAKFTRLGGRRLDAANLPTSLKAVEDALCWMMGADDGSPHWHPTHDQEECDGCGVRIVLSSRDLRS